MLFNKLSKNINDTYLDLLTAGAVTDIKIDITTLWLISRFDVVFTKQYDVVKEKYDVR